MKAAQRSRSGTTVVELLVVLAILGVVAGVTAVAIHTPRPAAAGGAAATLVDARECAVRTGRTVTVIVADSADVRAATAYPDGRLIVDDRLSIDTRSGRPVDAR
ncbi:MAG TPA: prepilin-type N-terminal cleavage/methylation domain-containing protein [Gemmatimonadaceae bacterium]|nr:prepilin-type N-terminal cleavage/methylation domain-containing protein [Gemmatimonadaceae bacterium]